MINYYPCRVCGDSLEEGQTCTVRCQKASKQRQNDEMKMLIGATIVATMIVAVLFKLWWYLMFVWSWR